jgi:hypothetical protein
VNETGRARRSAVLASALIALATLSVHQAFASRVASRPDQSSAARQGEGGQDVVVRAAAGIGQAVKADRWAPVLVSIDSSLPFAGELIVSWGNARVRRALVLPSAGRRQLELYLRTTEPEGSIRLRLISGARELQALDVPVRIVPASEPVTLCIDSEVERPQGECTAHASTDLLPRSVRGYDAVDRIVWSDADTRLSGEQRSAIRQRQVLHSLDLSGDPGLVQRPSRPERRRGLPGTVVRTTGAIVLLYVGGLAGAGMLLARRRARIRWSWLSAAATVALATVAVQAVGRIGPGAAIVVHHRALLEQVPGTDVSVLSMRAIAEFPAHDPFVLLLPVTDGTIEPASSGQVLSEQLVDEAGQPMIAGMFGLAAQRAFAAEAIGGVQPLAASLEGDTWTVANRSALVLERCRFAEGFSTAAVGAMALGMTVTAQQRGDVLGPVFTCEASHPVVQMLSPDWPVDMQGTTVIAVYKNQLLPTATGADD